MPNVFFEAVAARQEAINSLLCVGLDPEVAKIPARYQSEDRPILKFCLDVIDATKDIASLVASITSRQNFRIGLSSE